MRPVFCGAEKGGVVQLSRMQWCMCASGAQGQGGERVLKSGKSGAGQEVRGSKLVVVGGGSSSSGRSGLSGNVGANVDGGWVIPWAASW